MKSLHHTFDVHLAQEFSVNEAILIHHFQHWIEHNRRLKRNFQEDRWWMFQTIEEMAAHFCYLTPKQVEKTVEKLVKKKVLRKGNFNKVKFDRTLWYSFEDERRFLPISSGISPKREIRFPQKGEPIPHTKQDESPPLERGGGDSLGESREGAESGDLNPPSSAEQEQIDKKFKQRRGNPIRDKKKWEKKVLENLRKNRPSEINTNIFNCVYEDYLRDPNQFKGVVNIEKNVYGEIHKITLFCNRTGRVMKTVYANMETSDIIAELDNWRSYSSLKDSWTSESES